ncbi:MAG: GNAT family N-acetyltransferase [Nitrospirae bacterium YQR-1]
MTDVFVVSTADKTRWQKQIECLNEVDIYFLHGYARAFEAATGNKHFLFCFKKEDFCIIEPFCLRELDEFKSTYTNRYGELLEWNWQDSLSPYGYCGPVCSDGHMTEALFDEYLSALKDFFKREHIVSHFIRFNPLLFNYKDYFGKYLDYVHNDKVVVVNLNQGIEAVRAGYRSRNIKKANRADIKYRICHEVEELSSALPDFKLLYTDTMDRVKANQFYHFSEEFFRVLSLELYPHCKYFMLYHNEVAVAGIIVLVYGRRIHYFLSASTAYGQTMRANDFLLDKIMQWGCQNGYDCFFLGGGHPDRPNLLEYKKRFSNTLIDCFKGGVITDSQRYDALCSLCNTETVVQYFPLYRAPLQ